MFIRQGSTGLLVEKIQRRLQELNLYNGEIDSNFGPGTLDAVIKFQKSQKINADGIVGAATWALLFPGSPDEISTQANEIAFPIFQHDMEGLFGSPLESSFRGVNISFLDLSEYKNALAHIKGFESRDGKWGFWCHHVYGDRIKGVFAALSIHGLAQELETFDGSYVVRNMRGISMLSMHAFGFAADFNAGDNPLNGDSYTWSDQFLQTFTDHGFEWGGIWQSRFDPMHFQLAWTRDWRLDSNREQSRFPQFAPQKG